MSLFADELNMKALATLAGLVGRAMGLMMYWPKKRYGGDPEGPRAEQETKKTCTWRGTPPSPTEWESLRQKGMSEEQIAEVDKAAQWAGRWARRSPGDDPPAA